MAILSKETELEIVNLIKNYLEKLEKHDNKTDLIPSEDVEKDLKVSAQTLRRWENMGLRRGQPPIENGKKNFYTKKDLYAFLGLL